MQQRGFKQLTARDRLLIAKLKKQEPSLTEIARRTSRPCRANCDGTRRRGRLKNDSLSSGRHLWTEEELDEYLQTQPTGMARSRSTGSIPTLNSTATTGAGLRTRNVVASAPDTRKWVIEKLRLGWSPRRSLDVQGSRRQSARQSRVCVRAIASRQKAGREPPLVAQAVREAQAAPRRARFYATPPPSVRVGIDRPAARSAFEKAITPPRVVALHLRVEPARACVVHKYLPESVSS